MNWQEIYALIGPAGVALVVVGLLAVYIALRTFFYLVFVMHGFHKEFPKFERISRDELGEFLSGIRNPLMSIIKDLVLTHGQHSRDIRAEVAYLFHLHFKSVNENLCWLKLIAAVAPLMGLLGTVLGMVQVFRTISDNAAPDPTQLAAGIWVALVTTVMGLVIAIPVLMAYYLLTLRFRGCRIQAIEASYHALEIVRGIRTRIDPHELGCLKADSSGGAQ